MRESVFFYNTACSLPIACRADNTEAKVEVGVIGVAPELVAHLAVVGAVVPAAAAVAAFVAVVGVGIPAPLPHVTAHIIQTVGIRLLLCNRMSCIFTITYIPPDIIKVIIATVTVIRTTTSCSVLSFFNCR